MNSIDNMSNEEPIEAWHVHDAALVDAPHFNRGRRYSDRHRMPPPPHKSDRRAFEAGDVEVTPRYVQRLKEREHLKEQGWTNRFAAIAREYTAPSGRPRLPQLVARHNVKPNRVARTLPGFVFDQPAAARRRTIEIAAPDDHLPPMTSPTGVSRWLANIPSAANPTLGPAAEHLPRLVDAAPELDVKDDIRRVMRDAAAIRAERSVMQKQLSAADAEISRQHDQLLSLRNECLQHEQSRMKLKRTTSRLLQLNLVMRSKQKEVTEARAMLRVARERFQLAAKEAERQPQQQHNVEAPDGDDDGPTRCAPSPQTRKQTLKQLEAVKDRYAQLENEYHGLQRRLLRKAQSRADGQKAQLSPRKIKSPTAAMMNLRRAEQQEKVAEELNRKRKAEADAELHHIRENHLKGLRYLEREHQQHVAEKERTLGELNERLHASQSTAATIGKLVGDLKGKALFLHTLLKDEEKQLFAKQEQKQGVVGALQDLREEHEVLKRSLAEVNYEIQFAKDKLIDPATYAAAHQVNDKDRQQLIQTIRGHETQRTKLATAVETLQGQIAAATDKLSLYPFLSTPAAGGDVSKSCQTEVEIQRRATEANRTLCTSIDQMEQEMAAFIEAKKTVLKKRRQTGEVLDREIEQLTATLATLKTEFTKENSRNTKQLEELDLAERMIAMNNLK